MVFKMPSDVCAVGIKGDRVIGAAVQVRPPVNYGKGEKGKGANSPGITDTHIPFAGNKDLEAGVCRAGPWSPACLQADSGRGHRPLLDGRFPVDPSVAPGFSASDTQEGVGPGPPGHTGSPGIRGGRGEFPGLRGRHGWSGRGAMTKGLGITAAQ